VMDVYPLAADQWRSKQGCQDLIELFRTSQDKLAEEELVGELVASLPHHKTVVDLGCGPGRMISQLPDSVYYRGYDTSPYLLQEARRVYGQNARRKFLNRDLFAGAPYKRAVDVLLAIGLTRHYTDPVGLAAEIMSGWPAKAYVFDFLHAPKAVELINAYCMATAVFLDQLPWLGNLQAREDLPGQGDMVVSYVVLRPRDTASVTQILLTDTAL